MKTVEIRVRPVVRHIVTRYVSDEQGGSSSPLGEFTNEEYAEQVAEALRGTIPKPMQYAIVERGFSEETKVYFAEELEQAEVYRAELMAHFGSEFRIFAREVTDPIAKARIETTPAGWWQPLGLPPCPPPGLE